MGANISGFIEWRESEADEWGPWAALDLPRDYVMFAALAWWRVPLVEPVAEPRGLPADVSRDVIEQFAWEVVNWLPQTPEDLLRCVSMERAHELKQQGGRWVEWRGREWVFISRPEYHSASWLTPAELEEALRRVTAYMVSDKVWADDAELRGLDVRREAYCADRFRAYRAALEAMKALGATRTRLVFWFN